MPEIARIDKASVSIIYIKKVGICILIINLELNLGYYLMNIQLTLHLVYLI
jgi:hypothetical protein